MHTDHDRAAAEEAAPLRDERRGAPRRVRRALAAGVLQGAHRRRDARAPGVRVRRRAAGCSGASRTPRCGSGWASTPTPCTARWTRVNPPAQQMFQQLLFSKIVPNCKKLGLLDAADGWLRERFTEIGVIQFEDWVDTGEEYADARRGRKGPPRIRFVSEGDPPQVGANVDHRARYGRAARGGRSGHAAGRTGPRQSRIGSRSARTTGTARSPRSTPTRTGSCARCGRAACRPATGSRCCARTGPSSSRPWSRSAQRRACGSRRSTGT